MMDELHEISSQLMQPVKDLSHWNVKLGEILTQYCTLLEQNNNINFGEAALIIQNSANVYIRRIENLYDDTMSLNNNILNEVEEEETQTIKTNKKSSKKIPRHLDDFELLDFEKEVGKNINLKNNRQEGKRLKFLNRRFTQLENNISYARLQIKMLDIHGEVIGRKYDFRCNQQITKSGMLVDELTPKDFLYCANADLNETSSSFPTCEGEMVDTSDCFSDDSSNELENRLNDIEMNNTMENVTNECFQNAATNEDNFLCLNESGYISNTSISNMECNGDVNYSSDKNSDNKYRQEQNVIELQNDSGSTCVDNSINTNQHVSQYEETFESNTESNQAPAMETGNDVNENEMSTNREEVTNNNKHDKNDKRVSSNAYSNTESVCENSEKEIAVQTQQRRISKRIQNMNCTTEEKNKKWEAIPFDEGIPGKLPKARKQFKLTCHIERLKSTRSRKRNVSNEDKFNENVEKLLQTDSEPPIKKMNMYSPTRPMFTSLKKEEIEEFQKSFDLGLKSHNVFDAYPYDIISTIMMGFHPDFSKLDAHIDSPISYTSVSNPKLVLEPNPPDSYTPPMSPDLPDTLDEESIPSSNNKHDYKKILQKKMKEIFGKTSIYTELQENVSKWHEIIKPKLIEIEQRGTFHMREYSSHIIKTLISSDKHTLPFKTVVQKKSHAEVARYFLASLQLNVGQLLNMLQANAYNIDIRNHGGIDDNFDITLLNKENCNNVVNDTLQVSCSTPLKCKNSHRKRKRN